MKYLILILFTFFLFGYTTSKKLEHSFFVAGHTYGSSKSHGKPKGLYNLFKDKFQFINKQKKIKFGVLLGDVVYRPNAWPEAIKDISKLKMPVYIARGNHDGKLKEFEKNFGKSYRKFIQDNNLFIILDPNIDDWNITDKQLVFLMNTLRNDGKKVDNIFIFSHQVLWYTKEKYKRPRPNSTANKALETNFWTKIEPLLRNQGKPVFLYVGDIGNYAKRDCYYYRKDNNITFIGTGMGGGAKDNFIITNIYSDGSVEFQLIALNGENINSLGKLEDFKDPNFQ